MATLPDIDTTQVGWIAYWNAIDQGGLNSIDPEDVLSAGFITSYEIYDNGIDGVGTSPNGREINWRVKNDGWFVAWMDNNETYSKNEGSRSTITGHWDINPDWTSGNTRSTLMTNNNLEIRINDLARQLSNWDSSIYSSSDVGLYQYDYSSPTTATMLQIAGSDNNSNYNSFNGKTANFMYTSNTTLYYGAVSGHGEGAGNANATFENDTFAGGNGNHGSIDALNDGLIPDAEVQYTAELGSYSNAASNSVALLMMWD